MAVSPRDEQAAGEDPRPPSPRSLRGLLARLVRNTEPKPRKRPDDEGRSEVRGD